MVGNFPVLEQLLLRGLAYGILQATTSEITELSNQTQPKKHLATLISVSLGCTGIDCKAMLCRSG